MNTKNEIDGVLFNVHRVTSGRHAVTGEAAIQIEFQSATSLTLMSLTHEEARRLGDKILSAIITTKVDVAVDLQTGFPADLVAAARNTRLAYRGMQAARVDTKADRGAATAHYVRCFQDYEQRVLEFAGVDAEGRVDQKRLAAVREELEKL